MLILAFPVLDSNLYSLNPGFDMLPAPRGVKEGAKRAQDTGRPKREVIVLVKVGVL